jgi:hypothetical protein
VTFSCLFDQPFKGKMEIIFAENELHVLHLWLESQNGCTAMTAGRRKPLEEKLGSEFPFNLEDNVA